MQTKNHSKPEAFRCWRLRHLYTKKVKREMMKSPESQVGEHFFSLPDNATKGLSMSSRNRKKIVEKGQRTPVETGGDGQHTSNKN